MGGSGARAALATLTLSTLVLVAVIAAGTVSMGPPTPESDVRPRTAGQDSRQVVVVTPPPAEEATEPPVEEDDPEPQVVIRGNTVPTTDVILPDPGVIDPTEPPRPDPSEEPGDDKSEEPGPRNSPKPRPEPDPEPDPDPTVAPTPPPRGGNGGHPTEPPKPPDKHGAHEPPRAVPAQPAIPGVRPAIPATPASGHVRRARAHSSSPVVIVHPPTLGKPSRAHTASGSGAPRSKAGGPTTHHAKAAAHPRSHISSHAMSQPRSHAKHRTQVSHGGRHLGHGKHEKATAPRQRRRGRGHRRQPAR